MQGQGTKGTKPGCKGRKAWCRGHKGRAQKQGDALTEPWTGPQMETASDGGLG